MEPMIKVEHLSKSFEEHKVLNDVNISCEAGSIVGITGRNGSGKTVLFKCICGLLTQDAGKVYLNGMTNTEFFRKKNIVGAIIEEPAFLENYSGKRNLEYLYSVRNKKNEEHIQFVMQRVGLDASLKKSVGKYSMGMKQRLAIAQAIMENQEILLLDEPMNGLDNQGTADMRQLFTELKHAGKTILLASHNKEDIEFLCDTVYEMDCGKVINIII